MVAQRRSRKKDTGTIRAICASLGYGSKYKDDRYHTKLSRPALKFYKQYIKSSPLPLNFSGIHTPDTLKCAGMFLEKHYHLFSDTDLAIQRQKKKILKGLARLIKAQDYHQRKNENNKQKASIESLSAARANAPSPPNIPSIPSNTPNADIDSSTGRDTVMVMLPTTIREAEPNVPGSTYGRTMDMRTSATNTNPAPAISRNDNHIWNRTAPPGPNNNCRAPVAPMYDARSSTPASPHGHRVESSNHIQAPIPRRLSLQDRNMDAHIKNHNATLDQNLGHGPSTSRLNHNNTNLTTPSRPVLDIPYPNTPPTSPRPNTTKPASRTDTPSLWFALQGPKGDPETSSDKLVPEATFHDSTLKHFFKLVASRSGQPADTLAFITFRCSWGGRTPIVVNRYMTESQWNDIKENDILERYIQEREKMLARPKILIWVRCGDTSNICE